MSKILIFFGICVVLSGYLVCVNGYLVQTELESSIGDFPIHDAPHEVHYNKTKRQYWFPFNEHEEDECPKDNRSSIEDFPDDLFTQEQRRQGAIILHIFCAIYFFTITAMVVNTYYIPCIECICEDLNISPDVAAATFMATATAMPEFFTNTISIFLTDSDMGIGTVIGSMMFNILGVTAIVCLFAPKVYKIEWFPVSRDSLLYLIFACALTGFAWDNQIMWWGTMIMVIFVVLYYIIMIFNSKIQRTVVYLVENKCVCCRMNKYDFGNSPVEPVEEPQEKPRKSEKIVQISTISPTVFEPPKIPSEAPTRPSTPPPVARPSTTSNTNPNPRASILSIIRRPSVSPSEDSQITIDFPPPQVDPRRPSVMLKPPITKPFVLWNMPKSSIGRRIWWIYTWPIRFCLTFTVPSPKRMRRLYPLTFIMCIIWIAFNSYMIFWMLTVIGYTFYIPESVMGMTFLSFGGCTPEAITGFILTRKEMGGMSIANAIGSSSVAMVLSLGLPWFIRTMVDGGAYTGAYIALKSSGIQYIIASMILVIIVMYTIIALSKFKIRRFLGIFLFSFYVIFITLAILVEMDVFIGGRQC